MKCSVNLLLSLLILIFPLLSLAQQSIDGWYKAGSKPDKYEMGLDDQVYKGGQNAAFISSKSKSVMGFGTLMQTCSAKDYLNKRIKMTGYLKTENVKGWAGLWLRLDGANNDELGFDNMGNRPLKGNTDWTKCEIVMDVPEVAVSLNFGALLSDGGKIWFDEITFEIVNETIPVSSMTYLSPHNTDFESSNLKNN